MLARGSLLIAIVVLAAITSSDAVLAAGPVGETCPPGVGNNPKPGSPYLPPWLTCRVIWTWSGVGDPPPGETKPTPYLPPWVGHEKIKPKSPHMPPWLACGKCP